MHSNFFRVSFPTFLRRNGKELIFRTSASVMAASALGVFFIDHTSANDSYQAIKNEHVKIPSIPSSVKLRPSFQGKVSWICRWLQKKICNFFAIVLRSMYLAYSMSPAAITLPLLVIGDSELKKWWWDILRDSVRRSGPCATKFAQWISTRPDLFPLSLCKNLEDLQSKAIKHNWSETEKALVLAFGDDWRSALHIDGDNAVDSKSAGFSPVVLGSGCVAQVLLGKLGDRKVAVKIIHSGVRAAIEADVTILRYLSWLVETIPGFENFSLSECVEEFSSLMMLQLDMQLEADNLDKFRHNFCLDSDTPNSVSPSENSIVQFLQHCLASTVDGVAPFIRDSLTPLVGASARRVAFPEPMRPYVSPNILVESFEPGQQISEILDGMTNKTLRRDIATAGLDAILKMVFEDNFIHADLHPGNVLYHEYSADIAGPPTASPLSSGSSGSNNWGLCFIDAGLVSTLDKQDRRNFIELFSAVVVNDGKRVGELMVDRSRDGGAKCIDREKFSTEIGELVNAVHSSGLSLGRIGIGALLQKVLVLCYMHQVKLEPKFVSVMIAMGVVEGLGKRLDPDVDVLLRAAPYVLKAAIFK